MKDRSNFLPINQADFKARGWTGCDIILVTGDAYVDHPSYGAAIIGRVLENAGYQVGIIAQPDWKTSKDFLKLGRPRLFFGVTAGNLDSMISHYTASKKPRRTDDYAPGGRSGLRPNRATIVYANKIKELFPGVPVVLGGIEASLRRLAHFDYWEDHVRRSILLDAKADILVYGMGEKPIVEIAKRLEKGTDRFSGTGSPAESGLPVPLQKSACPPLGGIRGTVTVRNNLEGLDGAVIVPSYEEVSTDKEKFNEAFRISYLEGDPVRGRPVAQKHGNRFVIQEPPSFPLTTAELDHIYSLNFARSWHPAYVPEGVPGFETVRFSITSHRGCAGECSFCSLFAHQGRIIQSRSKESILREVRALTVRPEFKGTITDIGGPTANLYGAECEEWDRAGACRMKQCMMPVKCKNLRLGYAKTLALWEEILKIPKVKHLFIQSGLRYDLLVDKESDAYLEALCRSHVSGQLKVAPEHTAGSVLRLMNKPASDIYERFAERFKEFNRKAGKNQYLVNYWINSHPGSGMKEAGELATYLRERDLRPEQIQDFIPLPMTVSGCMYWTSKHPFTGEPVPVLKSYKEREEQRLLVQPKRGQASFSKKKMPVLLRGSWPRKNDYDSV